MSRIESGSVVIGETPCSLLRLPRDLQTMTQVDLEAKGLNFHMDDSALVHPYVLCGRLRLNQVLLNALSNALKFTHAGGVSRPALFPQAEEVRRIDYARVLEEVPLTGDGYVVIMTRGHKDDLLIQSQVMGAPCGTSG